MSFTFSRRGKIYYVNLQKEEADITLMHFLLPSEIFIFRLFVPKNFFIIRKYVTGKIEEVNLKIITFGFIA